MVGEAYEMRGSQMITLKDEEVNEWKPAERDREADRDQRRV